MNLLLVLLFVSIYHAATYCTRAAGVFNVSDSGAACLNAVSFGVVDCCFTCLAIGPGYNARCGSLYNFGASYCDQNAAVTAAAMAACGDAGTYRCLCTTGTDTSELFGTSLTDSPIGSLSTTAPTHNEATTTATSITLCTMLFIVATLALLS